MLPRIPSLLSLQNVSIVARGFLSQTTQALMRGNLALDTGNSPTFTALTLLNGQIGFPASQNASADANTLDDYEEGTWTPSPTNLTVVGTPTYTGSYTKIGRLVYVSLVVASTTTTASTAASTTFSGLPFAAGAESVVAACDNAAVSKGNGIIFGGETRIFTPTWSANAHVTLTGVYTV